MARKQESSTVPLSVLIASDQAWREVVCCYTIESPGRMLYRPAFDTRTPDSGRVLSGDVVWGSGERLGFSGPVWTSSIPSLGIQRGSPLRLFLSYESTLPYLFPRRNMALSSADKSLGWSRELSKSVVTVQLGDTCRHSKILAIYEDAPSAIHD